ncbi:hypothetical protein DLAC_02130 [Tieghemostelium lacteum]|uniref:Uncharacterized protein n=1 Tax=Tieghemostelium lacteum TaxID=361077 RepID=A0A152A441_TIELA|nr:hypothetical protein DLAC_02130 [Tieghemostelium lacteum]|eukprot:KYR01042.1 hypothetical protein DLAC_02130 [Tieghemostelium lacteum]
MTIIEVTRFFGCSTYQDDFLKFESEITLLSGPAQSGRSSLLFQYGYTIAKEGGTVLLITDRKKFGQSLPLFPEILVKNEPNTNTTKDEVGKNMSYEQLEHVGSLGDDHEVHMEIDDDLSTSQKSIVDRNPNVLKRIKIKYIQDENELKNYFMDFPSLNILPDIILIDDLSHYFQPNLLAKVMAFLKESICYVNNQKTLLSKPGNCKAIITDINTNPIPPSTSTTTTTTGQGGTSNIGHQDQSMSFQGHQPSFHTQNPQTQQQQNAAFSTIAHPKYLFAMQRWTSLVLVINEIHTQSTTTTTSTNTTTPVQNNIEKQLTLTILKSKESNRDLNIDFNIQVSNKTFKLESINYNKKILEK